MGLRRVALAGLLFVGVLGCDALDPATPTAAPAWPTPVATLPAATILAPPVTTAPAVTVPAPPSATPVPPSAPSSTPVAPVDKPAEELARALANPPPKRDVADLARRYRVQAGTPTVAATTPTPAPIGATADFWVADGVRQRYFQVKAKLTLRSEHVDFWVQQGENVDQRAVQRSVDGFEQRTVPTIIRDFGGDRVALDRLRVSILNVRLPGLVGYYSSVDEFPRWVMPFSNERPLIAMSLQAVQPGTRGYDSGLAHEFEHFVQFRLDPGEETWVNEGTAELAIQAAGLDPSGNVNAFLQRPDTQLNDWAEHVADTPPHYGAADLFFSYLGERFGGYGIVGDILARPERGVAGVDAALRTRATGDQPASFDAAFRDWTVANWANAPELADPRFAYRALRGKRVREESLALPTRIAAQLHQYGARYYQLPKDAAGATLRVEAPTAVPLVGAPPRGHPFWWSNRADSGDSRLTRSVDLTGANAATLRFATWYDLERDFDYAYVAASEDGGRGWKTLSGQRTSAGDPNGANYGAGLTGKSGGWVDERVDLSAYVGRSILLRFEMVTDDAYNGDGFAFDDARIDEIGWRDDGSGWQAEGFVRIENRVPERLVVRVAIRRGRELRVIEAGADPDGARTLRLPRELDDADAAAAIVTSHTPLTARPVEVALRLERTP